MCRTEPFGTRAGWVLDPAVCHVKLGLKYLPCGVTVWSNSPEYREEPEVEGGLTNYHDRVICKAKRWYLCFFVFVRLKPFRFAQTIAGVWDVR